MNTKGYRQRKRDFGVLCIQKDETQIKFDSEYIWLWVGIEPKNKVILGLNISKEQHMFVP